ncbi:hypothetical protein AVEN_261563-1 [Araneus ventricosus]|uniref:Uncharacterized protein n=1 Tax=Araneus ventricosus TaxID=182803 RepID=A0A4Y2AJY7_ARAVE|nr:hypothetical protein AVEN_261563-1 [Araneus ventricosus]
MLHIRKIAKAAKVKFVLSMKEIQRYKEQDIEVLDDPQLWNELRKEIEAKIGRFTAKAQESRESLEIEDYSKSGVSGLSSLRLPGLELPTFDGDHGTWLTFRKAFTNEINTNRDLSEASKFIYLIGALKGDPANLVSGFSMSERKSALQSAIEGPKTLRHERNDEQVPLVNQDQKPGLLSECQSKDSGCLFTRDNDSNLQVLLSTALIKVGTGSGNFVACRAMLHSGRRRCLITESCWKELKLKGRPTVHRIRGNNLVAETSLQEGLNFRPILIRKSLEFKPLLSIG